MTLSLNDYQQLSKRTMPRHDTQHSHREATLNFLIGANSELGELADIYKKELFHGHEQSHIEKVKELGDVLFYLAGLATLLEVDLETVARVNIEKLEKRYSNGFSTQASIERVDVENVCDECAQPIDMNGLFSRQGDKYMCISCTLKDW